MFISYITSDAYSPYCGISITSLFENNKDIDELEIFIVNYDLSEENKKKFIELGNTYNRKITFIDANPLIAELKNSYGIKDFSGSPVGYTRIFPHKLYPEYAKRVLYIDSDTIIISSLRGIDDFDLDDKPFAMAENVRIEFNPDVLRPNERKAFEEKGKNYNSGVILCDINSYIKNNVETFFIEELKKGEDYAYAEQSILNCSLPFDLVKTLPLKFNYYFHSNSKYEVQDIFEEYSKIYDKADMEEAERNPVIVHYIGDRARPWYKQAVTRRKKDFLYYKQISLWNDMKLQSIYDTNYYKNLPLKNRIVQYISIPLFNSKVKYYIGRRRR